MDLKADVPEVKTASNSQVTMTRYDLITFDTATMTFTEGVVCQYALTAQTTTPGMVNTLDPQPVSIKNQSLTRIKTRFGFRLNHDHSKHCKSWQRTFCSSWIAFKF